MILNRLNVSKKSTIQQNATKSQSLKETKI